MSVICRDCQKKSAKDALFLLLPFALTIFIAVVKFYYS